MISYLALSFTYDLFYSTKFEQCSYLSYRKSYHYLNTKFNAKLSNRTDRN